MSTTEARQGASPGDYRGNHRPPSRRPLLVKVAVVLGAVAVVLAGVGVVIAQTAAPEEDKGKYTDGAVTDVCPLVDAASLEQFKLTEEERLPEDDAESQPHARGCTVYLSGDADSATYVTAELRTTLRVYPSVNEAMAAFTGELDYERSQQREPELLTGVAEQAGYVTETTGDAEASYRLRARDSNATVEVTVFTRGLDPAEVSNDQVKTAVADMGTKLLQGALV